ncbi:PREDICTED: retinol dehydrogenase 13-like [Ceratosolen solmsi marchali]|uniref:Retinol dehydrogenase 13-like n=1 Tax=Ceratosolen solmsi marchali TaxID=326594 RepID=A0AAJ7DWB1_9HYME|nr:PREDICTED: retinol dehydrogenase 13-like [Ceratosolen solmsi marchali]
MVHIPTSIVWVSALGSISGAAYIIKSYSQGELYTGDEKLTNKVVIVTGANTGIGKEVAHDLAKRDAKVIMACRDLNKCEQAREEIVFNTKNKYVYCRECDLSSQESIRKFVTRFKQEHSNLHILINNAGVMRCPLTYTKEGIEMQIGVNHMGHFLLTNLLLDSIKKSAPARIVTVTSLAHLRGKMNISDLNSDSKYDPGVAYAQSKLANVLFTVELSKRLKGTGVTANSVHPGIVDTEITRHMAYINSKLSLIFLKPFLWPFIKTPKYGAQSVLYTALSPELDNVSGKYISNMAVSEASKVINRENVLSWLWKTSVLWTNLEETSTE